MTTEITYSRPPLWEVLDGGNPYNPFPWQAKHIHAHPDTQFILAACGRRSGKTTAVIGEVAREAVKPTVTILGKKQSPLIYVIGPTAELSQKVWQPVWDAFVPDKGGDNVPPLGFLYKNHDKSRRIIWLKTGGVIQGKSADDPKSLQGDRVTLAIVDEAHSMPEEAWQYLLPALLDSRGRLLAIGITKGKNRFRSMWQMGQGENKNYYSFSVPSWEHPLIFLTDKEAETARLRGGDMQYAVSLENDPSYVSLTETEQKQQYWSQWVEDDGSVFSVETIQKCMTGKYLDEPSKDGVYVAGLDVAKQEDWTVLLIGDVRTGKIVHSERITGIEYMTQAPRIARVCKKWKVRLCHMDVTSNLAVAEIFREEGVPISEFVFTNKSKNNIVNITVREMERGNIILPVDDEILTKELELFERKLTPSGNITFSAPIGYHDDMVDALCLLVSKMARSRGMSKSPNRKRYISWAENKTRALMPPLPKPKVAA